MKDKNANTCFAVAPIIAERLRAEGISAEVRIGGYKPSTSMDTWDDLWQDKWNRYTTVQETGFVHAWVASGHKIIDPTATQFGVEELIFENNDPRYDALGILVSERQVDYFSWRNERIIWDGCPEYANLDHYPAGTSAELDEIVEKFKQL